MKKNNKFRHGNNANNSNNNQYSLTYKFDSASIAGKISGTALDLIRKYNDLAKESQLNHDYVSAEVFRQYAEHYRKIVTDINEKKANAQNNNAKNIVKKDSENDVPKIEKKPLADNKVVEKQETEVVKKKTLRKKIIVAKPKEELPVA